MPKYALTVALTGFVLASTVLSPNAQILTAKSMPTPGLSTRLMMIASGACAACERALDRCNKNPPYGNDRNCASDYYDCIKKNHCNP